VSTNIIEIWRGIHLERHVPLLAGTPFEEVVRYFELNGLLFAGMNVLEIGVGLGFGVRGFRALGCNVYALDICEQAFIGIEDYLIAKYVHERINELPIGFVDLAISLLVTQHMSETDILHQFPAVIKSLNPQGRFRVQFAGSDIAEENNNPDTIVGTSEDNIGNLSGTGQTKVSMLGGRMVRTPEYAEALINKCGGKVVRLSGMQHWPHYKGYWYWLEVVPG